MIDEWRNGVTYEPCGCVTNSANAHRPGCPDWRAVRDINDWPLYWVRRKEQG